MSRKIDLSKKLTKDELAYLEARDDQRALEENKRLVRASSKPAEKPEQPAAPAGDDK